LRYSWNEPDDISPGIRQGHSTGSIIPVARASGVFRLLDRNALIFVDFMLRVFAISAGPIIGAATYRFLRTAKEGLVVETIAGVFA
jgi:hypothetical protein